MGLDMSHDAWHGAYSAFTRFRNELAVAAGYELTRYDGTFFDIVKLDWDRFVEKNYYGDWDTPPDDPLMILIVHSDCEGEIPTEYCEHLANRIEQLIPKLSTVGAGHVPNPQEKARELVAGLRLAASEGEPIEFY